VKLEGYKKIITTLLGMFSIDYVAYLIFKDNLDMVHKIELYSLIIVTLGALAGVHGLIQGKIDKAKLGINEEKK
jgi:hypothetical protein